jgi:2-amino-4-hydroxy-6-hydroxymethyldihydropteridine diphosphokinase
MKAPARHRALLLLGSNIERERNIPLALAALAEDRDMHLLAASRIYESAAVGGQGEQPLFSNGAALIETALEAAPLRQRLRALEAAQGRVRSSDKYAPRPIDLDIVLFDDFVGDVEGSPVPDPDLLCFAHVLVPCAEIVPEWRHPVTGSSLAQILEGMESKILEAIRLFGVAGEQPPKG